MYTTEVITKGHNLKKIAHIEQKFWNQEVRVLILFPQESEEKTLEEKQKQEYYTHINKINKEWLAEEHDNLFS